MNNVFYNLANCDDNLSLTVAIETGLLDVSLSGTIKGEEMTTKNRIIKR
jgi:hypothetical protein